MASPITKDALINAQLDADSIASFANDNPSDVIPRYNGPYPNIRKVIATCYESFQQFLLSSGYQVIGTYGPGLNIAARNQIFLKDGEYFRASAPLALPYVTTGNWSSESSYFVSVGDAALRQELAGAKGPGLIGLEYSEQYPSGTVGAAMGALANTPKWYSRRVMDPIFTADDGTGEIFSGAGRAVQGLVILDTPGGTKLYMISRPVGDSNLATERCRIVEFNYSVSTGRASHVQFTPELAVGHGEALGGYVDGTGQVWLYTTQSNLDGVAVGTNARKGFSRIRYKGAATLQSDVTSYQLFGYGGSTHELAEYNNGSVGLSVDGTKVLIVADSVKELARPTLFIYDRAQVEGAADPLAVRPLHRFRLAPGNSEGYGRVGVAADDQGIYVIFGTAPFSDHGVVVYDWSGRFIRDVNMDDARGEYTYDQLMGSDSTTPNVFELEGAALYQNKLHFVCLEAWRTVGDVVSFAYNDLSGNFACIASGSVGAYPYDRTAWVPTNRPATSGVFNAASTYNRGATLTTYRKRVYAISAFQDVGYLPISGRFLQRSSGMVNSGRNYFNAFTYNYPGILRFLGWNENTKAVKRTMEYNDGHLRLWDNTEIGDYGRYGSVRAKFSGTARFVSVQGYGGTETAGARSIWFGATDAELPGGVKELVGASDSVIVRQVDNKGEHIMRNLDGAVGAVLNIRRVGGSGEIVKFQLASAGTTYGAVASSTSNLQIIAKNGTDLCLSNATDDSTTYTPRWRVSASDNSFRPGADATYNLASSGARINNSFFAVAPTVSSDANLKMIRGLMTDKEIAAWAQVQPTVYQMLDMVAEKGEQAARLHCGYIAQEVRDAFVAQGLDPSNYALWCEDEIFETVTAVRTVTREKTERTSISRDCIEVRDGVPFMTSVTEEVEQVITSKVAVLNEDGSFAFDVEGQQVYTTLPVMEEVEEEYEVQILKGTRLSLRYTECFVLEAAYLRTMLAKHDARISALEG